MGNSTSVKLSEDTKTLEITEKFVRDLQYHMNLVDHSMTGFARSIDSLRESLAIIKKRENDKKDATKETTAVGEENGATGSPQDGFILETIDGALSNQKFVAFESLSKLFSFIIEIGNSCNISTPDTIFSLDKYRCKSNGVHSEKGELQYYDARLESMQKKLNAINTAYQIAKTDIENFHTREGIYQKEKLILNDKITYLETKVSKMKEEIGELIKEKNILEVQNEDLNREIYTLKENDEQMKHELESEKSSKKKIEEKSKAIKDECSEQIKTLERERNVKCTEIDRMQTEIEFLKENNASLSAEVKAVTTSKEQNISYVNSLNNDIDRLKKESTHIQQLHNREIKRLETLSEQQQRSKEELLRQFKGMKDQQEVLNGEKESFDKRILVLGCEKQCLETELKEKQRQLETLEKKQKDENDQWLMKYDQLTQDNRERESEMNAYMSRTELIISDRLKEMNKHDEHLSTSLSLLHDEVRKRNTEDSDVKKLQEAEIRRLTECLEQERLSEEEYIKTLNVLKEELQQCKEEKKSLEMQICNLERRNKCLMSNVKENETKLESTGKQHKVEIDTFHTKIQKLKLKKKEQRETNERLTNKIVSLNKTQIELSSQLTAEKDAKVSLTEDKVSAINSLQAEICKMNDQSIELKQMHEEQKQILTESIEKEIQKKEELQKETTDLKKEQERLLEIITHQKHDKECLMTDVDEKQKLIDELQLKVELVTKKVVYIQVMHQSGFHAAEVEEELQRMLKVRMVPERIDLQFLDCSKSYNVESGLPLLIVCSRNYSYKRDKNISFVTKGLKETQKMTALLIFHQRDEKAFRREVEPSRCTDSKLRAIFDVAYNKCGIYDCETNTENIEKMLQFISAPKSKDVDAAE